MANFKLKFNNKHIKNISMRYEYQKEDRIINNVMPRVLANGYLTKRDFLLITDWKTPRTRSRCLDNSNEFVKEITSISLGSNNERLKIEILTLLNGVSWPTASTILHFSTNFKYPILDFRALWSVNNQVPDKYSFEFWWVYTKYCRKLSRENNVNLRTLDRALWQYSKENQD